MREKIEAILVDGRYYADTNSEMADAILATISDGCEPVYQWYSAYEGWIDTDADNYRRMESCETKVRILYTSPVAASEPVADLEEAQANLAVLQEKYDNDCSSLELRVAAAEKDAGTYTDSIAELKNMEYRVNGLAHTWEFRADDALPVDAMLIMKMRRELCNAIAAGKD